MIGTFSHVQSHLDSAVGGCGEDIIGMMEVMSHPFNAAGGDEGLQTLAGGGVADAGGVHEIAGGEKWLFDLRHIHGHTLEDLVVGQNRRFAAGLVYTVV